MNLDTATDDRCQPTAPAALTRRAFALATTAVSIGLTACAAVTPPAVDPLPSWQDGPARQAILKFVSDVTRAGAPTFVPVAQRVAVFDNDGTLWSEQPQVFQYVFLFEQVKAAAPRHPEWVGNPAFKALVANDRKALAEAGEKALMQLILEANTGMTVDEYDKSIRNWLATARHPKFKRPFIELVYQPQLELLAYLRANGFKTYVDSGGTVDFMRPWMPEVYGIPPEQIIGSSPVIQYAVRDGKGVLLRTPKLDDLNDGPGKPVSIYHHIGQRPILAFGNSDGDLEMLQYTSSGPGPSLALIVHHDDAEREFVYDRKSKVGLLDKALDMAPANGWIVVSMKAEWKTVFPAAK